MTSEIDNKVFAAINAYIDEELSGEKVSAKQTTEFTVCHQESFSAAGVIVDKHLGSIGVVAIGDAETLSDGWLLAQLDNANYMQHLVLQEEQQQQYSRKAWQVELVLIVPTNRLDKTKHFLQTQALDYNFLYNIGVNCASYDARGKTIEQNQLEIALRWLLPAYRQHLFETINKSTNKEHHIKVELNNYRLPNQRELIFSSDHSYHIVHGQNGSGKSTFVEVLEWLKTGVINRLQMADIKPESYLSIVKNRIAKQDSDFAVQLAVGNEFKVQLKEDKSEITFVTNKLTNSHRLSFLIDQQLMDELTRKSASERASLLIQGFFPDSSSPIKALQTESLVQKKTEDSLNKAEDIFKEVFDKEPPASLDFFRDSQGYNIETLTNYGAVPLNAKQITELSFYFMDAHPHTKPKSHSAEEITSWLDNLKKSFRSNPVQFLQNKLELIQDSLAILRDLSHYQAEHLVLESGFADTLNQWLEAHSLQQILTQQLRISRSFNTATQRGWDAKNKLFATNDNYNKDALQQLNTQLAQLNVSDHYQQLMSHIENPDASKQNTDGTQTKRYELNYKQTEQLNKLGREFAMLDADADKPEGVTKNELGSRIANALKNNIFDNLTLHLPLEMNTNDIYQTTNINFGQIGAIKPLTDWLTQKEKGLNSVIESLEDKDTEKSNWLTRRWEVLQDYYEAKQLSETQTEKVKQLEKQVEQKFLNKIKSIQTPLNELMSLFTPARWAYEDLHIDGDESAVALSLKAQGAQKNNDNDTKESPESNSNSNVGAELIFNTAELNVFTLALFLLCAKPDPEFGGLLVWDDPLQNMDELTVTTLARGLARLQPLLEARGAKLVMFFHGVDDLARFKNIVHAESIKLPWVSPMMGEQPTATNPLEAINEASLFTNEFPPISEIFTDGVDFSERTKVASESA